MPLDRNDSLPLWAQLEAVLKVRLDDGDFDERFPTDAELVEQYGVSRHTVREAIRHLNRTGILRRERGRGTVVTRSEFEQPLGALYSLYRSIDSTGATATSRTLQQGTDFEPVVAEHLGLPSETELFFLERIRYADGEPLALDRVWMPLDLARPILDSNFEHTALYDELDRHQLTRPDAGWERIAPVMPTPEECSLLDVRRGEAAFFLERLGTAGGIPIEWRTTLIRGSRYRFVSYFAAGGVPPLIAAKTATD